MVGSPLPSSQTAKVILFGEHAVVYGKPAVAAALSRRTFLHVHRASGTRDLTLSFPDINVQKKKKTKRELYCSAEPFPPQQIHEKWKVDEIFEKLPDSACVTHFVFAAIRSLGALTTFSLQQ